MNNLLKRSLFGFLYVLIISFGTTGHPYIFTGLMVLLASLCLYEFIKISKLKDVFYIIIVLLVSGYIFYFFFSQFLIDQTLYYLRSLRFAPPVLFYLAVITIFFSSNELESDFAKATISVVYAVAPFAVALIIPQSVFNIGKTIITKEIFFIFILIWSSDSFAYLIGSKFGKHKMFPRISENKTWQGFIGGFVFTLVGSYIVHQYFGVDLKGNWIIIGLIIAVTAPIGDLLESKLKRIFNVKDSGSLIPGHGGFLDRLDSFIFVIPTIYTYFLIDYLT